MGRTKYRVSKPYIGYRRNPKKRARGTNAKSEEETGQGDGLRSESKTPETPTTTMPSTQKPSASATKLNFYGIELDLELEKPIVDESEVRDCNFFVQLSCLQKFFALVACPGCHELGGIDFELEDSKQCGFAKFGLLSCSKCHTTIGEDFLCQRVGNTSSSRSPFEINLLSTLAFRGIGCGYSAMKEWSGTMNLSHCMSQNAFSHCQEKINVASKETFDSMKDTTLKKLHEEYEKVGTLPDEDGVLDIGVSFDGSWHRRGHSSHTGIATVIDLRTGLLIDYEILSNFCSKCKIAEGNGTATAEWKQKHSVNCLKNFDGSANAMEAECARRLWSRSLDQFKLRYTTMLCDGDSKSYDAVSSPQLYGPEKNIDKEDCINHISKRMGTALQKFVATEKAKGESIAGKGKLTQQKIMKIQNFYGRAVKDNSNDLKVLKKRIFAILFHLSSSDEHPKHIHCPPGKSSWCFWQKAVANEKEPGSHKDHKTIPTAVRKEWLQSLSGLLMRTC